MSTDLQPRPRQPSPKPPSPEEPASDGTRVIEQLSTLDRLLPVWILAAMALVLLFALQGHQITHRPLDVVRIALPLLAYFALMFAASFAWGIALRLGYRRTATLAFTAASNNFELAIAVAIGVFGATSGRRWPAWWGRSLRFPS